MPHIEPRAPVLQDPRINARGYNRHQRGQNVAAYLAERPPPHPVEQDREVPRVRSAFFMWEQARIPRARSYISTDRNHDQVDERAQVNAVQVPQAEAAPGAAADEGERGAAQGEVDRAEAAQEGAAQEEAVQVDARQERREAIAAQARVFQARVAEARVAAARAAQARAAEEEAAQAWAARARAAQLWANQARAAELRAQRARAAQERADEPEAVRVPRELPIPQWPYLGELGHIINYNFQVEPLVVDLPRPRQPPIQRPSRQNSVDEYGDVVDR